MRVITLGTGAAIPTEDRCQTGFLLESEDTTILLDCGAGILHRLAQLDRRLTAIDAVLLTHTHLDHVADIPGLAKARLLQGTSELTIAGPSGTREVVDSLLAVDNLADRVDLSIEETSPGTNTVESCRFEARETRHSKPCLGYRFGDQFGYSGDTEADVGLLDFFDGLDVLVHDCAYPDTADHENHATPSALASALEEVAPNIGRLYLTHLYPDAAAEADDGRQTVAARTGVPVEIGTDRTVVLRDG